MLSIRDVSGAAFCAILATLVAMGGCSRTAQQQPAPAPAAPPPASGRAPGPAAAPPPPPASSVASWDGFMPGAGPVLVGRPVKTSDLTETQQKYGMAPERGAGAVYQDQVVLIEHGDKAVKAWSPNGIEWTLDGNDPRVAGLQEGQILFATSRCVGRVLKLTRTGNDVSVILGPVQLTDLIKQGNFGYDEPLDLATLAAVQTPNFPGAFGSPLFDQMKRAQGGSPGSGAGAGGSGSMFVPTEVRYYVVTPRGQWRPVRTTYGFGGPAVVLADDRHDARPPVILPATFEPPQLPDVFFNDELQAAPCWQDCGGLGLRMTATKGGVTVKISVVFYLHRPQLRFAAGIENGSISGWVSLSGAGGFDVTVYGISDQGFSANINQTGEIPVDLVLPMPIGGVPLEAHFHQNVSLATGFSAKTSVLKAKASFDVSGNLTVQYKNHQFIVPPIKATLKNSLSGDVNGVSMGIDSLVFSIDQRLLVGVGAAGFSAGPYVGLTSGITALKQASEAMVDCRMGTFLMSINGGIGYSIPKIVATVVNFFLGLVHAKPIEPSGSIVRLVNPKKILDLRSDMPPNCAGKR
jgi:hypothetical protein